MRHSKKKHDVPTLNQIIADRLLQRLDVFRLQPNIILDVGAGNGYTTRALTKRYKKSKIFGVDLSPALLKRSQPWFPWRRVNMIAAQSATLPLAKNSVDMIFSNLIDSTNVASLLREFQRVLRPQGLLLFTTLGRDTLVELQKNFGFVDMHDVGDQLTQCRFVDPVMDVEYLTLQYSNQERLRADFDSLALSKVGLDFNEKLSLTLELIYGHAWGNQQVTSVANDRGEILVPLSAIHRG